MSGVLLSEADLDWSLIWDINSVVSGPRVVKLFIGWRLLKDWPQMNSVPKMSLLRTLRRTASSQPKPYQTPAALKTAQTYPQLTQLAARVLCPRPHAPAAASGSLAPARPLRGPQTERGLWALLDQAAGQSRGGRGRLQAQRLPLSQCPSSLFASKVFQAGEKSRPRAAESGDEEEGRWWSFGAAEWYVLDNEGSNL